ncbi:hypothetical protein F4809DRAFT_418131 [Biscogniauxia mediterranea]|nr:hypothetical protein F4809DRAFT_418131 [Biscogniauxia mediterranea]
MARREREPCVFKLCGEQHVLIALFLATLLFLLFPFLFFLAKKIYKIHKIHRHFIVFSTHTHTHTHTPVQKDQRIKGGKGGKEKKKVSAFTITSHCLCWAGMVCSYPPIDRQLRDLISKSRTKPSLQAEVCLLSTLMATSAPWDDLFASVHHKDAGFFLSG